MRMVRDRISNVVVKTIEDVLTHKIGNEVKFHVACKIDEMLLKEVDNEVWDMVWDMVAETIKKEVKNKKRDHDYARNKE